ncbi:hypothetical protein Tco_0348756 [Tanacetum coccineum]
MGTMWCLYDLTPSDWRTIDQSAIGKLRAKNVKESWALIDDLALYDNESWNDPKDFAKPVKAISLPHDVPNASNRRLIELKNQVQCLMEAHFASKPSVQVNKIASSCKICSGPHDTQYCMENPEQAFVDYASSHTDEAGVFIKMVEFLGTIPINLNGNMWESKELTEKKIDWNKPPKEEDGVRHIKIEMIDPDGEKFNKTFQSIPTTRKLSEKENPSEIIDLEHIHEIT